MKNYGVAETARLFETDLATIKNWVYQFSEYLSKQANPQKGIARNFTIEDIRIFSYICLYWEEEPDIECIKMGLNKNSQFDNLPIDNFIKGLTPAFFPMPPDIDETWGGVVFGGEFELGNLMESANSFRLAGDRLIEIGFDNYEQRDLFQPAMYSYRHALELYVKSVTGEEISHDLKYLYNKLNTLIKTHLNANLPQWFDDLINAFDKVDPKGTAFRYGITISSEELYADIKHIKDLMNWVYEIFKQLKETLSSL